MEGWRANCRGLRDSRSLRASQRVLRASKKGLRDSQRSLKGSQRSLKGPEGLPIGSWATYRCSKGFVGQSEGSKSQPVGLESQ